MRRRADYARCARFRQPRAWRSGAGGEYPRRERRPWPRRRKPRSRRPSPRRVCDRRNLGKRTAGAATDHLAQHAARELRKSHRLRSPTRWSRCDEQKSWTEIPFGTLDETLRNDLPWDPSRKVEIPGAGIFIQGHIDRLDLSGDGSRARVIDYKTGKLKAKMAEVVIDGGGELQRCLYAFAVKTLLGANVKVEAALLYPAATEGEQTLFPLQESKRRSDAWPRRSISRDATSRRGSLCPASTPATHYNDFAFALPASASYLPRKLALAEAKSRSRRRHMGSGVMADAKCFPTKGPAFAR